MDQNDFDNQMALIFRGMFSTLAPTWRGEWEERGYEFLDLVTYEGRTWIATEVTCGAPGVDPRWELAECVPTAEENH